VERFTIQWLLAAVPRVHLEAGDEFIKLVDPTGTIG